MESGKRRPIKRAPNVILQHPNDPLHNPIPSQPPKKNPTNLPLQISRTNNSQKFFLHEFHTSSSPLPIFSTPRRGIPRTTNLARNFPIPPRTEPKYVQKSKIQPQ